MALCSYTQYEAYSPLSTRHSPLCRQHDVAVTSPLSLVKKILLNSSLFLLRPPAPPFPPPPEQRHSVHVLQYTHTYNAAMFPPPHPVFQESRLERIKHRLPNNRTQAPLRALAPHSDSPLALAASARVLAPDDMCVYTYTYFHMSIHIYTYR
jgi:hypothetical protein